MWRRPGDGLGARESAEQQRETVGDQLPSASKGSLGEHAGETQRRSPSAAGVQEELGGGGTAPKENRWEAGASSGL